MYSIRHKHAMLDIETASSNTNAAVLTIGIYVFDPMLHASDDEPALHIVVPFSHNEGREITLDTVSWWMQQNPEAQRASWVEGRADAEGIREEKHYITALAQIFDHVDHLWANDPDFDCDILKHFFAQHGVKWKWYRKHRSLRTLKAMYDVPFIEQIGSVHNALDDCRYQAETVRAVYQGRAFPTFGVYDPTLALSHRTLVIPPNGVQIAEVDFSQLEQRVIASQGAEALARGRAIHEGLEKLVGFPEDEPGPDVYKGYAGMIFDGEAPSRPVASHPALGAGYGADAEPAPPSPAESDPAT